ncbi:MAG: ABC transporter ATP-binding protein [bacterium]|nr:MAG: ABC transporter ATP-binding protein [bacterium]
MRKLYRILSYVLPYWKQVTLNTFFNILTIVFSLFSLALLIPFLNLLFGINKLITVKPVLYFSTHSMLNYLNYYISQIIIHQGKIQALVFICIIILVSFFFKNFGRYFAMFFMTTARSGAIRGIRDDIYAKLLIQPLSYYTKNKKGDLITRITSDVQELEISILNQIESLIRDPITIIAYLAFMLSMSLRLSIFILVILPVTGLIIGLIGRNLQKNSLILQNRFAGLMAIIEESISGLRVIKGFNAIPYFNRRFGAMNKEYCRKQISVYRRRDISSPLSEFLSSLVIVVILWFGGQMVLSPHPTIQAADFITFIVVFSQVIPPSKSLSQSFFNIKKGLASADRIFEVLDADEVIEEKPNALPIKSFEKEIKFENVFFKYQKHFVIKDINILISKGKMIAIVGESGGGKSTIVDLLPRFYDVTKGRILLDGHDVRDFKISELRSLMGIVSQDSILFNDSVFNNIAFGLSNASQEAVEEAAKVANAHDFIIKMEEGYQTSVGDRGVKLSGGQRQRLSIARAVLANPDILILDEATSSLDTEAERLVQDALSKIMKNRTTLVIAHRLSTIRDADEIIVMQKGEIVERGPHDILIKQNGIYKRLQDLQSFK